MDFFGIGPMELMLILILALVVFGPGKLPEIGAKLGSALREMRKATREFSREIDETRQAIEGPINDMKAPMQDLTEPFQAAGAAVTGARDMLSNPSKAIEGYVMGQYAAAEKPAATTADEPAPAQPTEPAEVPSVDAVATEAGAAGTAAAEAVAAGAVTDEAVAAEPAALTEDVATTAVGPMAPIAAEMTPAENAAPPDPGVASAIAAMENIFPGAVIASSASALAGEADLDHKMPGAAEAQVAAADSEGAAPEPLATTSLDPVAASAPSDVATGAPEPPQVPARPTVVESVEQVDAGPPPPPPTESKPDSSGAPPTAARRRHRPAPRVVPASGAIPPPDQGTLPSSDQSTSQG